MLKSLFILSLLLPLVACTHKPDTNLAQLLKFEQFRQKKWCQDEKHAAFDEDAYYAQLNL